MNIQKFYKSEIQSFIKANLNTDLHTFLLKKSPFADVSIQELAQQIKGRKIAEKKFPFLLKDGIIFPPNLNLEQSSSANTAEYKANLLKGKSFIDLTSGFGIDAYFLSKNFENVILIERNEELLKIVEHNWKILDKKAKFISVELETFIDENQAQFDVVYLDPARRNLEKKKVFLLEDLSPNILEIQNRLLEISDKIIIKLSPMIDISYLVSVLKNIFRIDIIAVKNDVKEIVVYQNSNATSENIEMHCVNLETENPEFIYNFGEETNAKASFSEPKKYIYIPNNAILKSGSFNLLTEKLKVEKLHPNSHIYTSENYISNFPGRILEMKIISSKEIKKGEKWNVISKNHPFSPAEIEKKYKIKQGGKGYLIFTESQSGKIILKTV